MRKIVLVACDVRSAHNVGSLMRTSEGLGVEKVYLTGITPYPPALKDQRLPHIKEKIGRQIAKTALGADKSVKWDYVEDIEAVIESLSSAGYEIVALEQAGGSISLPSYKPQARVALIVGSEVDGLSPQILQRCSKILEIPMSGTKESFNVSVAAGIALYHLKYTV